MRAPTGIDILVASVSYSGIEKSLRHTHCKGMIGALVTANKTYYFTTPATFETIDARHSFSLLIRFRNTPEIVLESALAFGPAYSFPLQQVIRHQVPVFVA